jgi:hypothetical protein
VVQKRRWVERGLAKLRSGLRFPSGTYGQSPSAIIKTRGRKSSRLIGSFEGWFALSESPWNAGDSFPDRELMTTQGSWVVMAEGAFSQPKDSIPIAQ